MLYGPWLSDCAAAWQSGARGGCRGAVLTALAVACLVHSSAPEEYVGALRERCLEGMGSKRTRALGRVSRGLGSDGMVGEGGIPEWVPEWVHAACGIGLENGDDGDGGGGRGIGACLLPLAWMQLR